MLKPKTLKCPCVNRDSQSEKEGEYLNGSSTTSSCQIYEGLGAYYY